MLEPFERHDLDARAVMHRIARIAVFVDQPVGAPGEVVFKRVHRVLGQGADAHMDVAQALETPGDIVRDDRDESGGKPTLGNEGGGRAVGNASDRNCRLDILGQIEIMCTHRARCLGH